MGPAARQAGLLPEDDPARTRAAQALALAIARWARLTDRPSLFWESQHAPANQGPLAPHLRAAGFVPIGPGFRLQTLLEPAAGASSDEPLEVFEGDEAEVET